MERRIMDGLLFEKHYAQTYGGNRCPRCYEDNTVAAVDQMEVAGTTALQPMECSSCGLNYTENWRLVGYSVDEEVEDDADDG